MATVVLDVAAVFNDDFSEAIFAVILIGLGGARDTGKKSNG